MARNNLFISPLDICSREKLAAVRYGFIEVLRVGNWFSPSTAGENIFIRKPELFLHISRGSAGRNSQVGVGTSGRGNDGYVFHVFRPFRFMFWLHFKKFGFLGINSVRSLPQEC